MHMTYATDLNTALEMAYGWIGPSASVVVIPNGPEIIVK
jgi:hypothetical protein